MSLLWKVVVAGLVFVVTASAYPAWRCQASDSRGIGWYAVANNRGQAARIAMRTCMYNARHPRSCDMDYCQRVYYRGYDYGDDYYRRGGFRFEMFGW